jgi:hypothetical protein
MDNVCASSAHHAGALNEWKHFEGRFPKEKNKMVNCP